MRRMRTLALAAVVALAQPAAHAEDSPLQWLERMADSLSTRNYDGLFTHTTANHSEVMRILHRVQDGHSVERLVSLDGFGLPDRKPEEAPAHLERWLDAWGARPPEKTYPSLDAIAERLRAANPRLDAPRSLFMAKHLSRPAEGGFAWRFDPMHRAPFATLHRVAEWAACVRRE